MAAEAEDDPLGGAGRGGGGEPQPAVGFCQECLLAQEASVEKMVPCLAHTVTTRVCGPTWLFSCEVHTEGRAYSRWPLISVLFPSPDVPRE